MAQSVSAFLGLGTNLPFEGVGGAALLARAVAAIEAAGVSVMARSSVWLSSAWPLGVDQPDYFNAVIAIDTSLTPDVLWLKLESVEAAFGRERRERWAARTLDLDVVDFGGLTGSFGPLILPHPHAHERAFVLAPLSEIAPDWRHPRLGKTAEVLLRYLDGADAVKRVGPFPR
jgi:2-amino-4-hydroxy-6-hydroxymethyldihydropteridine diphosphokinase